MTVRRPTIHLIQQLVAEAHGLTRDDLKGRRQTAAVARPRMLAMALAVELVPVSTTIIGRLFGGRDHTTVLYARDQVAVWCAADAATAAHLDALRREIAAATAAGDAVADQAGAMAIAVVSAFSRSLFELVRQDPLKALALMQPLAKHLGAP